MNSTEPNICLFFGFLPYYYWFLIKEKKILCLSFSKTMLYILQNIWSHHAHNKPMPCLEKPNYMTTASYQRTLFRLLVSKKGQQSFQRPGLHLDYHTLSLYSQPRGRRTSCWLLLLPRCLRRMKSAFLRYNDEGGAEKNWACSFLQQIPRSSAISCRIIAFF